MPYRKPKRSYVLPVVTTLAVAAPLATFTLSDSIDFRSTTDSELAAVPAQLAEMALASAPDITLPLKELTGLKLPDLHLSDLRMLPSPSSLPIPDGLPLPGKTGPGQSLPGRAPTASFIADPSQLEPGTTPETPALAPGAVPPALTNQVGAQVKELNRDTSFSVVALTASDLVDTKAMVRARQPDGTWGPWYDTEAVDTRRDDRAASPRTTGTEPIYVGKTKSVQILVTRKPTAATAPDHAGSAPVQPIPAAARSDDPAQMNASALTAVLIDPGRSAIDGALSDVAAALPGDGPNVISRAQWGADESIRCEEPTYDDALGGVTVHHTAGRNDYSKSESAGIVRAIYTYHAKTLGWCDIGYNALVDKYGQIFEGRFGGLDRPVQGAHAGGFNENTSGVALMGNHESQPPTDEALNAVGKFVGWRTKVAGLDPKGYTTMYSEGTQYTPYAEGESVRLPVVFAHRDVGNTTCPGDAAYALMDRIRDIAASSGGRLGTAPQAGDQQQSGPRVQTDLAALAALTTKLLGLVNQSGIAKYWSDTGSSNGPLGVAQSDLLPAAQGQQYAKFANGYVYSAPDGQVYEVLGPILDRFLQLGADAGVLGLPLSNAYPVPDGVRSDFQHGSLVLNQLTGIVTTVWKTYNETYQQRMGHSPNGQVAAPGPAPAHGAAPAPGAAAVPGGAPAPGAAVAPSDAPSPGAAPAPEPAAPEAVPVPEQDPAAAPEA